MNAEQATMISDVVSSAFPSSDTCHISFGLVVIAWTSKLKRVAPMGGC